MMTLLFRGKSIAVPTVETALRFLEEERLERFQVPVGRRLITGAPGRVREAIEKVASEYEADEVLVVNIMHSHEGRLRSYELIAREFGLVDTSNSPGVTGQLDN
jgi:alkanesulfonate monooxygenase SsuD/methylene tetrahydromethanopterin reductase-like flavin-dependent oxidoreductase (luciferase family)